MIFADKYIVICPFNSIEICADILPPFLFYITGKYGDVLNVDFHTARFSSVKAPTILVKKFTHPSKRIIIIKLYFPNY